MNNTFIIIFFFSIHLFSQDLKIHTNNQEFFLKTNNFEEKILITKDTVLSLNPGIYNFYNDSLDFVIFLDTLQNYNLSFSSKNGIFFDGLEDSEFQFFNQFFESVKRWAIF